MSHIRLIISDIDGTILNDQHQLDPSLVDLIPDLKRENVPLVLASARSPLGVTPIAQELGLQQTPLACYNGALIIEGDMNTYQTIFEHPIDKEEALLLVNWVKEHFPSVSINLYSGLVWIVEDLDQWNKIEGDITGQEPIITNLDPLFNDPSIKLHKILFISDATTTQSLYKELHHLDLQHTAFYLSKDNYLEITAKHVSKEDALVELAHYYQLSLDQILTIGDNYNDIPMLQKAGIGVAMGNAPQEVKAHATVVTKTNNENGVGEAIETYVLI